MLRIRLAALNPADAFLAQAMYPAKPPLPHILGRDGVGEVLELGPGVDNVTVGETAGILRCNVGVETWGTLAEKAVIPATSLAPVSDGWSLEEMAGAPLVFLTAWQALTQWSDPPAPPREETTLLVTGAAGGVGVVSVLLGKSMGLTVIALSRSAEKRATLQGLGADFAFDPRAGNLRQAVNSAIAPKKVDIAVDNVGDALFNQVVAMLGYGGRISVVGRSGGTVPEFNTASLLFRRIQSLARALVDFVKVLESILEGAVSLQQFGGGLVAYARDAGNIVGDIPFQRLEIDELSGLKLVALLDRGLVISD